MSQVVDYQGFAPRGEAGRRKSLTIKHLRMSSTNLKKFKKKLALRYFGERVVKL